MEWTAEGITWEADPRHAELIRKSFGVTGSTTSKERPPIDKEAADRCRANTMRAQYLSSDTSRDTSRVSRLGAQVATAIEPGRNRFEEIGSILRSARPGATRTTLVASEPEQVFVAVH